MNMNTNAAVALGNLLLEKDDEITALHALLRRVEWNGFCHLAADHVCPICSAVESNGHADGCELQAALARST